MRKRFVLKDDDKSTLTVTMDTRLLDPPPIVHIDFTGFNSDKHHKLPHICKFVAWIYSRFIILAIMVSSCTVIIIYGDYFSTAKTYLWVAAFLLSFISSTVLLEPLRILLMALVKALIFRRNLVIERRKISPSLIWNPENPEKKQKLLNLREHNAKLYRPTPLFKLQNRFDDIKYHLEMKTIILNFLLNVLFFWFNVTSLFAPLSIYGYYGHNAVVETFVNARYTHSIKLSGVETYETLQKYLNETFLPALFPDPARDSQFGYMVCLGKARIRQLRVRSGSCKMYEYFKTRHVECPPELHLFNVETRDFSVSWKLEPSPGLTEEQKLPWKYQSAWQTSTLPILTAIHLYPGGGYILELPKTIDEARLLLEDMDRLHWVDTKTRVLVFEFTLFCINTNYFHIVHLIFQRSATGYFFTTYRIDTCNFTEELSIYVCIYSVICCKILIFIVAREFIKIHSVSFKEYINRAFAVADMALIIAGIIRIILIVVTYSYVRRKITDLEYSDDNSFISLTYAYLWFFLQGCAGAILMCVSYFQFLQLLCYKVIFYKMQKTLSRCLREFMDLVCKETAVMVAFAVVFHITLCNCCKPFSDLGLSLTTLLSHSLKFNYVKRKVIAAHMIVASLLILIFFLISTIVFVNLFLSITCLYFRKVYQISMSERYHFYKYLTFALVHWRHNDIIHFKERGFQEVSKDDPFGTLRLRGGGSFLSKKPNSSDIVDEDYGKVHFRDFVTEKLCDTTHYLDLLPAREAAMRYLTIHHLSPDLKVKTIYGELSLSALFYVLTADDDASKTEPRYFFVLKGHTTEVYECDLFARMRKAVEEYAKEVGILKYDHFDIDDIPPPEMLTVLDEKLHRLVKKTEPK